MGFDLSRIEPAARHFILRGVSVSFNIFLHGELALDFFLFADNIVIFDPIGLSISHLFIKLINRYSLI